MEAHDTLRTLLSRALTGHILKKVVLSRPLDRQILRTEGRLITLKSETVLQLETFTADGKAYTLRAAKTTDDISGIYLEGEALGACADKENTDALFWKEGCWARWFDGEMQYSLFSAQNETESTNAFLAVCDALK